MQGTGSRRRRILVMLAMVAAATVLVVVASELGRLTVSDRSPGEDFAPAAVLPATELLQRPTQCTAGQSASGRHERHLWRCLTAAR